MDLFYVKLALIAFAFSLIGFSLIYDSLSRKLSRMRRKYKLQIQIRTNSGSTICRNRYYPTKSLAVIGAWWHGPNPKTAWIMNIQTSIEECNG